MLFMCVAQVFIMLMWFEGWSVTETRSVAVKRTPQGT